jgi:Tol biopolymer transport system component
MKYFSHRTLPHRLSFLPLILISAFAVLAVCFGGTASAQDAYKLVSPAFAAGQSGGDQHSYRPAISADGRYIAFTSQAKNLVSFPTSGSCCLPGQGFIQNVFIRDVQVGQTKLVSVNRTGHESGNGTSYSPSISADGRFVTFSSTSSDLVDNDTNGNGLDVFIRDTVTDTTTLVSTGSMETGSLDGDSSGAVISSDGRFVAFLNSSGDSSASNVVLRDLQSGTTKLVSVNYAGTGGGNGSSSSPSVSADGRLVSFQSLASDLLAAPSVSGLSIYVRDMNSGVTTLIPTPQLEFPLVFRSILESTLSADGRYVIFSYSYNLFDALAGEVPKGNVARYDLETGMFSLLPDSGICKTGPRLCSVRAYRPSASADGRFVTFAQTAIGSQVFEAVFLGDFLSLATTNVTTQPLMSFNAFPSVIITPVISTDGSSVAFSTHNRLTPQDGNSFVDVYRFDHDPDPAGLNGFIGFGQPAFRAEEGGGSVTIPVLRNARGATGPTSVQFTTGDGTANADSDYVATSGTLTFAPGEDVKFVTVSLLNDNVREGTETFAISLSNPTDGYFVSSTNATTKVFIHDSIKPGITINDIAASEGGDIVFTVTLSQPALQFSAVRLTIADGTATGAFRDGDYDFISDSLFGRSVFFNPGQQAKVFVVHANRDLVIEPAETLFANLSPIMDDYVIDRAQGTGTILDDPTPVVEFVAIGVNFSGSESDGSGVVTVKRTSGDPAVLFSVNYATADYTASERSDYIAALGRLDFAPGELSKTFTVLINNDVFIEDSEEIALMLSSPTNGAVLGKSSQLLRISSEDVATPTTNPLDESRFFVTQHYKDFLNRLPDPSGVDFWTNELNMLLAGCDSLPAGEQKRRCVLLARAQISTAFFLSIESQETGYLVYRLYHESFNRDPTLREFLADTQEIGRGVVVGAAGWELKFEANKQKFADDWVKRPDFRATFDAMPNNAYVSTLFHFGTGDPSAEAGLQMTLTAGLNASPPTETRATVLRKVADSRTVFNRQYNPGLVLLQYFTYLRRNPDDAPDNNFEGYNFWLAKLDQFSVAGEDMRNAGTALARIRRAEMVEAFVDSGEYRQRFGP